MLSIISGELRGRREQGDKVTCLYPSAGICFEACLEEPASQQDAAPQAPQGLNTDFTRQRITSARPWSPYSSKSTVVSSMGGPTTASLTNGDLCIQCFPGLDVSREARWCLTAERTLAQQPFTSQSFSPSCNCSKKMVLWCKGASAWYKLGKSPQVTACPPGRRGGEQGH